MVRKALPCFSFGLGVPSWVAGFLWVGWLRGGRRWPLWSYPPYQSLLLVYPWLALARGFPYLQMRYTCILSPSYRPHPGVLFHPIGPGRSWRCGIGSLLLLSCYRQHIWIVHSLLSLERCSWTSLVSCVPSFRRRVTFWRPHCQSYCGLLQKYGMYIYKLYNGTRPSLGETKMKCEECGTKIPQERLKILPNTKYCIKCSDAHDDSVIDIEYVTSKSSGSGRNGFAPKD